MMITVLSARQMFSIFGLGLAAIIEVCCAIAIIKRDPHYQVNRFTGLAYISLAIALISNITYVFIFEKAIVAFLHRVTNFFGIITAIFLFLSAMYISEGPESIQSYRMVLVVLDIILGLLLFFSPDVTVYTGETALPGSEQFIEWGGMFFLLATIPIYLSLFFACYYYLQVWREVPSDRSKIKRASSLIILGTLLLGISHFSIVIPHILRPIINDVATLVLTSNLGSVGVLIASLLIFGGFRTRISESNQS